jgi:nitrite reductase/ring-hydroxylating ferredoxin subunit
MEEILHFIGVIGEFPPGKPREVTLGEGKILVMRNGESWFAYAPICPHRGAPLRFAHHVGNTLICNWHGSEFDLRDGRPLCGPAECYLSVWRVSIDGDSVYIAIKNAGASAQEASDSIERGGLST